MKYDYRQYKIDTLLRMAKATGDIQARERYIAEADVELQNLCKESNMSTSFSYENFYTDCLFLDGITRTKRKDVFETYLQYCKDKKEETITKQAFYRYLRKMGVHFGKIGGYDYFLVKVEYIKEDDTSTEED